MYLLLCCTFALVLSAMFNVAVLCWLGGSMTLPCSAFIRDDVDSTVIKSLTFDLYVATKGVTTCTHDHNLGGKPTVLL